MISSHSGGRIYDSSEALDIHTYSLCTFTCDVASGEYLANRLYGFDESASGYGDVDDDDDDSVLLKLNSLP